MPTVEQLTFEQAALGNTQNARLLRIFRARPNEWIPMPELAELIGAYAVHSRVADLRTKHGMTIRTRTEGTQPRKSFYMYEPEGSPSTDSSEGAADLGAAPGTGKGE